MGAESRDVAANVRTSTVVPVLAATEYSKLTDCTTARTAHKLHSLMPLKLIFVHVYRN